MKKKKKRFITHYQTPVLPEIKLEPVKPPKVQHPPKIKEKEQIKQIKPIEKKSIIVPPQIPRNLFYILHNQNKAPIIPPKIVTPHLKKKRLIEGDDGNAIGRWTREEHKKFIEAIIKFGNNWKEVQEYVHSRTSTQARSHAQKFFEKIKKNNTLKYFDTLKSDYSENFTNATILQLHDSYGKKTKSEINSVVNKFLSLEYDLPKKRRKLVSNNVNGIPRKKIIRKNNDMVDEFDENEIEYEEQEDNEDYKEENNNNKEEENNNKEENNINKEDNNDKNNENTRNNDYNENQRNLLQNNLIIENGNIRNLNEYYLNNFYQKGKIPDDITASVGIDYILNQFVNNLSNNNFDLNCPKLKINKRKNTLESLGDESEININYINQANNFTYNNNKSRKNSVESYKLIPNDKTDFNEIYKRTFGLDEQNQNLEPLEMNNELKFFN